jgi:hypothetical protein
MASKGLPTHAGGRASRKSPPTGRHFLKPTQVRQRLAARLVLPARSQEKHGNLRETSELNQLKFTLSHLLPDFLGIDRLQSCCH